MAFGRPKYIERRGGTVMSHRTECEKERESENNYVGQWSQLQKRIRHHETRGTYIVHNGNRGTSLQQQFAYCKVAIPASEMEGSEAVLCLAIEFDVAALEQQLDHLDVPLPAADMERSKQIGLGRTGQQSRVEK